tara:strand:- start:780 stop:1340 length:561 start_codon:yes stop_codon:yes gene_type:complete
MFSGFINRSPLGSTNWNLSMGGRINISDKIKLSPVINSTSFGSNTYYSMGFPYILFKLESQLTKKVKIFNREGFAPACGVNTNDFERYVVLTWNYNTPEADVVEDLTQGKVIVGNDEFPLGFYNLTIYEMVTNDDLNPDNAISTLYNGLVNMYPNSNPGISSNFQEVQYKDYTNNDADTESVYITY